MEKISSLKDARVQTAKSLNTLSGRLALGKMLVEGVSAIEWAIDESVVLEHVFAADGFQSPVVARLKDLQIPLYALSEGLLKKITGTKYVIPIVAVASYPESRSLQDEFSVVLDGVQDVGNIGTIVRTCRAFGITKLLSSSRNVDLFNRKTVSASRGKVFSAEFQPFDTPAEVIDHLREKDYQIVVTSPYGNTTQSMVRLADRPVALVVGNETNGVSPEMIANADIVVQIPLNDSMESLNVGVATGISVYELRLKKLMTMMKQKIQSTIGRELNVASQLARQVMDQVLAAVSDFTSGQVVFLMVLECDRSMEKTDIQRQFGLTEPEVVGFLKPLSDQYLIENRPHGRVEMTEKGTETIGKLWTVIENAERKILNGINPEEEQLLRRLLKKIQKNCIKIQQDS